MIAGLFHRGSGIGNQLFRYVATRVLALDKGYDFTMINQKGFKGKDFMNLDMGLKEPETTIYYFNPSGAVQIDTPFPLPHRPQSFFGNFIENFARPNAHCYDPDINFVEDNTIIDGNFEDERYFEHRLPEILTWLKVQPLEVPDDVCLIGFRGGEYYTVPELGLPKEYFDRAIGEMLKINSNFKFEVHTDDPELAKQFFPNYRIIKDIEKNWVSMRRCKYAIIANSSFYVLPRLLSGGLTIAPRYWNRYNVKKWQYPQNYYKKFRYI